ncbi:uncharacterized protein LOC142331734 [Lycorma delicatula]|uniref:uncharacterized protein LOC142331734 n=1 Tax=Lycorma delicatula TaxID=130591 RepID=UPI003F511386
MLFFYYSLRRSCLDYGCVAYFSARQTVLKMLDGVHHAFLRLATGAFRSTPIASLLVDCGEPSLWDRRDQLLLSYFARLKGQPNHLAFDPVLRNPNLRKYEDRPCCTAPVGVRTRRLLQHINVDTPSFFPSCPCSYPPWRINLVNFTFDLTTCDKHSTPPTVFWQMFQYILTKTNPDAVIYTDGSKQDDTVGCAFVVDERTYMFGLPGITSVFTAELLTINKALNIVNPKYRNIFICSDSCSALQVLENFYSKHPVVIEIYNAIAELGNRNTEVNFCWVPSHVGIPGNEQADYAAKEACIQPPFTTQVTTFDFINHLKQSLRARWQSD